MTSINLHASVSEQVNLSDAAEVRQIANFAWQHLKAARTFRDQSAILERAALGQDFGDFFIDIRSYVSATILSAAASFEALINELFISPHCALRPMLSDFEKAFWGKDGIEHKPILAKYKRALKMLSAEALDETAPYYTNAWALIELRNSLIHYKPTWDPDRRKKISLTQVLNGKYELSPFAGSGGDFLTMKSMSAGCAAWAVDSVFKFIRVFDGRTNLDPDKMVSIWLLET